VLLSWDKTLDGAIDVSEVVLSDNEGAVKIPDGQVLDGLLGNFY